LVPRVCRVSARADPIGTGLALSDSRSATTKKKATHCHPFWSSHVEPENEVQSQMERLIRNAWRAFWVGLGASSVLIAQSVIAPAAPSMPASGAPITEPAAPQGVPVASPKAKSADPILSRNPFDSNSAKTKKLVGRGGNS
jgi:hypothetical protein